MVPARTNGAAASVPGAAVQIAANTAARHSHANKRVLDGITAAKTAAWDGKSSFSGRYADLTGKPAALKNPNALTIKIGGTTVTYDGSAAKTVTIADGSEAALPMAKKLYEEAAVQAIAGAIRAKNGSGATYKIGEMAAAVQAITGAEAVAWHQCPEAVRKLSRRRYLRRGRRQRVAHRGVRARHGGGGQLQAGRRDQRRHDVLQRAPECSDAVWPPAALRARLPLDALRWLNTPQAANVRDLGGWACDGGTVRYGLLFRGGEITAADRDVLNGACGVRHELNLRGAEEASRTAFPAGQRHPVLLPDELRVVQPDR